MSGAPTLSDHLLRRDGRLSQRLGVAALVSLLSLIGGATIGLLDTGRPLVFGHDLVPAYVAGRIVADGHGRQLFDAATLDAVCTQTIADANLQGVVPEHARWINPGFFALCFAPLGCLPYRPALLLWTAFNAGLATLALLSLSSWIGERRRRIGWLVLVIASCPMLLAVEHQQNTFLSLTLLVLIIALVREGQGGWAGAVTGLLAYKPQLAVTVGLVVWLLEGRRALFVMCVVGVGLLAAGEWAAPSSTLDFIRIVPARVASWQALPGFNWGRQMTPSAALRIALGGERAETARLIGGALSALLLVGTLVAVVALKRSEVFEQDAGPPRGTERRSRRDEALALALLALPATAPYFMDYDLLLLAIPAALFASRPRLAPPLVAGWLTLWLVLYVNVDVSRLGWPIGNALLLGLGWMSFRRELGGVRSATTMPASAAQPLPTG